MRNGVRIVLLKPLTRAGHSDDGTLRAANRPGRKVTVTSVPKPETGGLQGPIPDLVQPQRGKRRTPHDATAFFKSP